MRVFVAVDIEGVASVVNSEEASPGNPEYERTRRLMTAEASAVVAGIFDADPHARVAVADAHGPFRNLIPEELDERATLIRGKPRRLAMVDGIDQGFDAAMLLGVHGRAGTGQSILSHTITGQGVFDVRVNGAPFGELGLNAAVAGAYGVPVILVAGDQSVAAEAATLLGNDVVAVKVKEGRGQLAAETLHPKVVQARLREAAARAMRERANVQPLQVKAPVEMEITLMRPVFADLAELIENVERVDGRTIRFTRPDYLAAYRVVRLVTTLCSTPV